MLFKNVLKIKAATLCAAFIFLVSLIFSCAPASAKVATMTFEEMKKKANSLLVQKQKSEALSLAVEFFKNQKPPLAESADFLIKLSQTFMSKEAQEAYEASLNATLENKQEARQQIEICLQLEPQNADCLVQKIRIEYREKNKAEVDKAFEQLKNFAHGTRLENWVELALNKQVPEFNFKNKSFIKRINEKPTEDFLVLVLLEIDRSFEAKNFSRAKEAIDYVDKNFSEWPEIIFYQQKIENNSFEMKPEAVSDANTAYQMRCKNLTKSIARKYRYDFDLCQRGVL